MNHLRQQYPEMNNKQLQELYTRWYLRNSQNTQTTQQSTVLSDNDRYHLSNIYNLIENQHTQTPFHTQYQNNSQNYSHSQGDRLPTQHNYRNSDSNIEKDIIKLLYNVILSKNLPVAINLVTYQNFNRHHHDQN